MKDSKGKPTAAASADDWGSRSHVHTLMLMGVTAVGIYLCYRVANPFLPALAWALALVVLFNPVHRSLEAKLKRPNLAAAVSVVMIGLIVIVPAAFVGQRLVQEATKGTEFIKAKVESGEWRRSLEGHPRLEPLAGWMERQNFPESVKAVAVWMTTTGSSFVKGSLIEVLGLILTFYLLFFFLRDRHGAFLLLRSVSPLSDSEMDRLCNRVGDIIHATIYGTLAVSAAQGFLGGLMFWWLGLPAPLLWGVVMALLAVVPVFGAFVILDSRSVFSGHGRQLGQGLDPGNLGRSRRWHHRQPASSRPGGKANETPYCAHLYFGDRRPDSVWRSRSHSRSHGPHNHHGAFGNLAQPKCL